MTTSITIKVGFASGDYPDYSILDGTLAGSGNPGTCLDGGASNIATDAMISIKLPSPSTITNAKFDWWNLHTSPYNSSAGVQLFDADNNLIWGNLAGGSGGIWPVSAWRSKDSGAISHSNVDTVVFYVGSNWANGGNPGPATLQNKLDNCEITFTLDGPPEPLNPSSENCPETHSGEPAR